MMSKQGKIWLIAMEKKLLKTKNCYSDIHPIKIFTSERNSLSSVSALLSMIFTVLGFGTC